MDRTDLLFTLEKAFKTLRKRIFLSNPRLPALTIPTPAQGHILHYIHENPKTSITNIARALNISGSAVTQHVDQLVEKKMILRTEAKDDRRKVTLSVSLKAQAVIAILRKAQWNKMAELTKPLTDEELTTLVSLINKISQ